MVNSSKFSTYAIMSSEYKDSFLSSFPICIPFSPFYFFIALTRTSSMMLNRSGEVVAWFLILELDPVNICFARQLNVKPCQYMVLWG